MCAGGDATKLGRVAGSILQVIRERDDARRELHAARLRAAQLAEENMQLRDILARMEHGR